MSNKIETYCNPLVNGADPFILPWDGKYYLYSTNSPDGYIVYESADLVHWENRGLCLEKGNVYGDPTPRRGFWAPEIYRIDGRFYMFYTVAGNIGVAVADSPLGPFKKHSEGFLFPGRLAIDANLLIDDDGQMYIYYVIVSGGNEIYGAKFDLKTCSVSDEHLIIAPQKDTWEWVVENEKIAEGPCMIKHNGCYYLTYSCNFFTSQEYAVGYAISSSPLTGFERFEGNPVLAKSLEEDVYGTGHHNVFTSFGGEMMIVYHSHKSATDINPRTTCIDRCGFEPQEKGPDKFVVYGPTATPQKLP